MLAIDGAVGSGDGGLDVAKCGVDPFEGRSLGSPVSRTCVDDLMRTSGVGHAGKTVQAVADYGAIGTEAASGKCRDRRPAEAGNPSQLHANRLAFGRGFHRSDKRCLTGCSTAPLAAPALATDSTLEDTARWQLWAAFLRDLEKDTPSSLIAAVPEPSSIVLAAIGGGFLAVGAVRRRLKRLA